jgi:hypothetical protein
MSKKEKIKSLKKEVKRLKATVKKLKLSAGSPKKRRDASASPASAGAPKIDKPSVPAKETKPAPARLAN